MEGRTPTLEGDATFFTPRCIFILVLFMHILDHLLSYHKKQASNNPEKMQLRQEIKQLLQEASSLSTPSTFAQAAKLRRQAAAKEKELNKYQEEQLSDKNSFYSLSARVLFIGKAILYLGLGWQFWGVPVVEVPSRLLQPFGRIMGTGAAKSSGLAPIGIVPWLMMTTQVSGLLCQKLSGLLNL